MTAQEPGSPVPPAETIIRGSGNSATLGVGRGVAGAVSIAGFLAVWFVAALLVSRNDILPSPLEVAGLVWKEAAGGELWRHLFATLSRVVAAFVLAMATGAAIGIALGRGESANRWFDPLLVIVLNLPALVVIVLCYVWIGLNEVAAILAVAINKIPTVAVLIREGARALDPQLDALAKVYRVPATTRLASIVLPQLAPSMAAAARSGMSLIWKIVLVVEFLGRSNGVGFQIHLYFQLFDVGMILAYSFAFIAVMMCVEVAILQPLERRANRWRRA